MKVLNIMLSRGRGGIQQAFLDYSLTLQSQKTIEVINITSLFAAVNTQCSQTRKLLNIGPWDIFSILHLMILMYVIKPNLIIAHGNRALSFVQILCPKVVIVGVAHNDTPCTLKKLNKCNYIIALTQHMRSKLIDMGFPEPNIVTIPNMISFRAEFEARDYHTPITIGVMARFVHKKGIDVFLNAIAILKSQNYSLRAVIGGTGEEQRALKALTKKLALDNDVSFIGWVHNLEPFFRSIDIFCLPSREEPFGIVLLEAIANSVPVIATSTDGPSEIIHHRTEGMLCSPNSSTDLAMKIAYLMVNKHDAKKYAKNAYIKVQQDYDKSLVARRLANFCKSVSI